MWQTRGLLLYLLPLPVLFGFLVSLVRADLRMMGLCAGGLALLLWGAALTRRGLREEAIYRRRKVARPPALPRKTFGGLLVSLAAGCGAYFAVGHPLPVAAGLGAGALAGFFLTYGFDPRRTKLLPLGPGGYTADEVLDALEEANTAIGRIEAAQRKIRNAELSRRLGRIGDLARGIVELIEEDPRDLRRARKFLNVYLAGARQVAEGYALTHRRTRDEDLEQNFRNVLATIEDVFGEQREKLLENDVLDLDVQIEVLSAQLKREGVV